VCVCERESVCECVCALTTAHLTPRVIRQRCVFECGVCANIHIHRYVYGVCACESTYVHIYTVQVFVCVRIYIYVGVYKVCVRENVHIHTHIQLRCVCVCEYTYIQVCIRCVWERMYIYTHVYSSGVCVCANIHILGVYKVCVWGV